MKTEEINKIKEFSIKWITLLVGKHKNYKNKLIEGINQLLDVDEDEYNSYQIHNIETWDTGMSDLLNELIEVDNVFSFSKKAQIDFICTIRIAIDLFVYESAGVYGFTRDDIKKFIKEYPEYYEDFDKMFELEKLINSNDENFAVLL